MSNRLPVLLTTIALTAACAGKTFYQSYSGLAPQTLPDSAYACVGKQLGVLGFKRDRYDAEQRWISARRVATKPRESSAASRRWYDQLDVQITPDSAGGATIRMKAGSFLETNTTRGPTTDQTPLYRDVEFAADSLIKACGWTRS
jgi:hypothetical protein